MKSRAAAPPDRRSADCGIATSTGHRRRFNEDAILAGPVWFAVADGMGGHLAGDVASSVAVESLAAEPQPRTVADIHAVVRRIDRAVRARAERDDTVGMGTTVVGATSTGDGRVAVFHVGDSRRYRVLDGVLEQLTVDHSQVQELIDAGLVSSEAARSHPLRNVITRALGFGDVATADVKLLEHPGRLLLCSDGLSGELEPDAIIRVLAEKPDPQRAADLLVYLALRGEARDNVTALVVDFETTGR